MNDPRVITFPGPIPFRPAPAYAVKIGDEIRLDTLYSHKRGAIVNWLMSDCGLAITNNTSDKAIFDSFDRIKNKAGAELVRVLVTPHPHGMD
jgi:hypothetical protein